MATITIKNIPDEIYDKIKIQAKANRRSVNSEIISIFEQVVHKRTPADMKAVLSRARQIRELTGHYIATHKEITRWKKAGRE